MSYCKHVGHSSLLAVSQRLDHVEWEVEDASRKEEVEQSFIDRVLHERRECALNFNALPSGIFIAPDDAALIRDKFFRLDEKIVSIVLTEAIAIREELLEACPLPRRMPSVLPLPNPKEVIQQEILSISNELDRIQWTLDDQLGDHPVSEKTVANTSDKISEWHTKYLIEVLPKIQPGADEGLSHASLHFLEKRENLAIRVRQLVPIEPIVSHLQFVEHAKTPPAGATSTSGSESAPEDELLSMRLKRITPALCYGVDTDVLQALNRLPPPLQKSFFDSLWIVRGRPTLTECMGHKNFGEILFTSTSQQRACAIELVNLSLVFSDLTSILNKNDLVQLRIRFADLPVHIQNEIFRKHWEQMGSPTLNSPKEFLRKMAHDDFGRVSFLGYEARCDVFPEFKVKTLEAYLIDYNQKITAAQALTEQIKGEWSQLDLDDGALIEKKIAIKKKNLQQLATEIIPLFEGEAPMPFMSEPTDSYHVLGKAYVETHSCLKPFFLQLMNNL